MIRRLVDVHYTAYREQPTPERISFWLRELRTPEFLLEAARAHAEAVERTLPNRSLLRWATRRGLESGALARALRQEEDAERRADEAYWQPLRERLSQLRREARRLADFNPEPKTRQG